MLSSTLKQSVATLGVVAGLLAAAGPASAQVMPGTMGVTTQGNHECEWPSGLPVGGPEAASFVNGCAPGRSAPVRHLGSEGVRDDVPLETASFTIKRAAFRGEVIGLEPTVKALANADEQMKDNAKGIVAADYLYTEANGQPINDEAAVQDADMAI